MWQMPHLAINLSTIPLSQGSQATDGLAHVLQYLPPKLDLPLKKKLNLFFKGLINKSKKF